MRRLDETDLLTILLLMKGGVETIYQGRRPNVLCLATFSWSCIPGDEMGPSSGIEAPDHAGCSNVGARRVIDREIEKKKNTHWTRGNLSRLPIITTLTPVTNAKVFY